MARRATAAAQRPASPPVGRVTFAAPVVDPERRAALVAALARLLSKRGKG